MRIVRARLRFAMYLGGAYGMKDSFVLNDPKHKDYGLELKVVALQDSGFLSVKWGAHEVLTPVSNILEIITEPDAAPAPEPAKAKKPR